MRLNMSTRDVHVRKQQDSPELAGRLATYCKRRGSVEICVLTNFTGLLPSDC
jgi:hypothetical protein